MWWFCFGMVCLYIRKCVCTCGSVCALTMAVLPLIQRIFQHTFRENQSSLIFFYPNVSLSEEEKVRRAKLFIALHTCAATPYIHGHYCPWALQGKEKLSHTKLNLLDLFLQNVCVLLMCLLDWLLTWDIIFLCLSGAQCVHSPLPSVLIQLHKRQNWARHLQSPHQ